eukprot:scaffold89986_cov39-Phaeocystis_antarctica.AAC.1
MLTLERGYCRSTAPFDEAPGRMPVVGGAGADIDLGGCMCSDVLLSLLCKENVNTSWKIDTTLARYSVSGHKTWPSLSSTAVRPLRPELQSSSPKLRYKAGFCRAGLQRAGLAVRDLAALRSS